MGENDERCGESIVLSLSLHPTGDLPKEIKVKIRDGTLVVSESDRVFAWTKARI